MMPSTPWEDHKTYYDLYDTDIEADVGPMEVEMVEEVCVAGAEERRETAQEILEKSLRSNNYFVNNSVVPILSYIFKFVRFF